ncbi:conserved hypothetical protein, partial [Ricinus communis]
MACIRFRHVAEAFVQRRPGQLVVGDRRQRRRAHEEALGAVHAVAEQRDAVGGAVRGHPVEVARVVQVDEVQLALGARRPGTIVVRVHTQEGVEAFQVFHEPGHVLARCVRQDDHVGTLGAHPWRRAPLPRDDDALRPRVLRATGAAHERTEGGNGRRRPFERCTHDPGLLDSINERTTCHSTGIVASSTLYIQCRTADGGWTGTGCRPAGFGAGA